MTPQPTVAVDDPSRDLDDAIDVAANVITEGTVPASAIAFRAHVVRRILRRPSAAFGVAVVLFFVIVALLAPILAPQDPLAAGFSTVRKAPSVAHWFGTDEIGRDVASRVIFGARAARMKSSALTASVCPRDRRTKTGVAEMPIAIIAFVKLGPRNAASAIARIRNGQASIASVIREMSASVLPPA